jgi:hypothetical protein
VFFGIKAASASQVIPNIGIQQSLKRVLTEGASPCPAGQFLIRPFARSPDTDGKAQVCVSFMVIAAVPRGHPVADGALAPGDIWLALIRMNCPNRRRSPAMITAITLDDLHRLSDEALWALFDDLHDLLEVLPCGSWERGIARANLRLVQDVLRERRHPKVTTLGR